MSGDEPSSAVMNRAIHRVLVDSYRSLSAWPPAVICPTPANRHVLAAAIRCGAEVIADLSPLV